MDKQMIAEAVVEAAKSKDAIAPGAVITLSSLKWISTNIDPLLTTLGLLGAVVWVWVRIWAHITLTRRKLATPLEGGEA